MLAVGRCRDEIFVNRQVLEDTASFGYKRDAAARDLVRLKGANVAAVELDDAAPCRAETHDAMHGRRFPHTVAAEEGDDFAGVERDLPINAIAKAIGRAPSTVQRELRRNMSKQQYRTRSQLDHQRGRPRTAPWEYRPSLAQRRADNAGRRPKSARLATNLPLREIVQAKLIERLSPEQIAVELRSEFPDDSEMWVSHETIYQSIYVKLRCELAAAGYDAGPQTIHYHLSDQAAEVPSVATIWRILQRKGLITPQPHKRTRSSFIRFLATLPN